MQTEYSSLRSRPDSGKTSRLIRGIGGIVIVAGVLGAISLLASKSHVGPQSYAAVSTSSPDYDYVTNKLISYLSHESDESFISSDCIFSGVTGQGVEFNSDHEELLTNLLIHSEGSIRHFELTTIVKPSYSVEFVFGTKTAKDFETEHFVIVFQIDPDNDYNIFEVYVFTSQQSDDSAETLYHRLFSAFDFNKNGVLCITEFPAMMGAITGLGNIEMSNDILSFMSNSDNHIKFDESEFVQICLNDDLASKINNFGELRHLIQTSVIDGYLAMTNDASSCLYYDLSWNCVSSNEYYATGDDVDAQYTASDSIFASVCCKTQI